MKKKFMLAAVAAIVTMTISLSSCSKNPADKMIDTLKDATEQLQKVNTADEANEISYKVDKVRQEYLEKLKKGEITPEQEEARLEAEKEYYKAYSKAWKGSNY